jgi:hypothetical protein
MLKLLLLEISYSPRRHEGHEEKLRTLRVFVVI